MFANGETVVVLAATTSTDANYNRQVEDWSDPAQTVVDGVAVEPRDLTEAFRDGRPVVTSGFTLYFPAGTTVTSQNRVRVRGEDYAVEGDPAEWRSPFSDWAPGIVVQTRRLDP